MATLHGAACAGKSPPILSANGRIVVHATPKKLLHGARLKVMLHGDPKVRAAAVGSQVFGWSGRHSFTDIT